MVGKQILRDLRACQVFAALSDTELAEVAALVSEKEYGAGTTIFREGDSADEFLVLQEGKIALQMTLPREHGQVSRRATVDIVSANEIIGWSAIVEPYTYTLTAVCLQRTKALSISSDKIRWLLEDNPRIGYKVLRGLIKVVASRLRDTRQVLVSERSSS